MIEEKEVFYTCKYDRSFKEIMLKETNRDILFKLLEQTLNVKINNVIEENIELNQGNVHIRRKNLDILLSTDIGIIGIEMNASPKDYLHTRNYAFHCDNYSHYTLKGKEYNEEEIIIQINFKYGLKQQEDYEKIKILEKYYTQNEEGRKYVKNSVIYEWNMDKIMELWYSNDEEKIEKYKYLIMLDLDNEELKKISKKDRMVTKYMEEINKLNEDPMFREYMTKEQDDEKKLNTEIHKAINLGIEQGMKQGKNEEKLDIAFNLKKSGFSFKDIAENTGLPIETIENL